VAPRCSRPHRRTAAARLRHHPVAQGALPGLLQPKPGLDLSDLAAAGGSGLRLLLFARPRRRFAVTEVGRAWVEEQRAELDTINAQLEEAAAPIGEQAIGEAIQAFRSALFAKMRKGALDAERAGKLRDLLERARCEIEDI